MEELEKGQPLKLLRPGVKEKFLSALAKGASYQIACGYAGISYQTLRRWIKYAEAIIELHEEQIEVHEDKVYFDFYCDLRRVESYAALKWLEKIDNAANSNWQAAAWKLERRFPDDYSLKDSRQQEENKNDDIKRAQEDALKLKKENNGRTPQSEG